MRQYKKRGLFTIMYHLLGIAKHHLSSTTSKSPRYIAQALPCNFLTESFIWRFQETRVYKLTLFILYVFLYYLYHRQNYFSLQHKISNFHFIKIEIKRKITVNQFKYLILQD